MTIVVATNTNLKDVTYAKGEGFNIINNATLTIDGSTAVNTGSIQCVSRGTILIKNESATTPIVIVLDDMGQHIKATGQGRLIIRGTPMEIGIGDGTEKTWDFKQLYDGVIPEITYVEVETFAGSGKYKPWGIAPIDPKYNDDIGPGICYGSTKKNRFVGGTWEAGKFFFWHHTDKVFSTGNGINGCVVPTGCRVRIPNIYITNRFPIDYTYEWLIFNGQNIINGGTYTVSLEDESGPLGTTPALAWNTTPTAVAEALSALPSMGPSSFAVSYNGGVTNFGIITNGGKYAKAMRMTIDNTQLQGKSNPRLYPLERNRDRMSCIWLEPAGTMDAEWVCFTSRIYLRAVAFTSLRLWQVGLTCAYIVGSTGDVDIDGVVFTNRVNDQMLLYVSSCYGNVSLKRLFNSGKNPGSTRLQLEYLPNVKAMDDLTTICYAFDRSLDVGATMALAIFQSLSKDTVVRNFTFAGGYAEARGCPGIRFFDVKLADQPTNELGSLLANVPSGLGVAYSEDAKVIGVSLAAPSPHRQNIIYSLQASKNTTVTDVDIDGRGFATNAVYASGSGMKVDRIKLANNIGTSLVDEPGNYLGTDLILRKLFLSTATGFSPWGSGAGKVSKNAQINLVSCPPAGIARSHSGVTHYVAGNWTDVGLSPTTGHITVGPMCSGEPEAVITGTAWFDQLGLLYLPSEGDTALLTVPYLFHGVTSFVNAEPLLFGLINAGASKNHILVSAIAPTSGTFKLSVYDQFGAPISTTSDIPYNASSGTIAAALNASSAGLQASASNGGWTSNFYLGFPTSVSLKLDSTALVGGKDYEVVANLAQNAGDYLDPGVLAEFSWRLPNELWSNWAKLTKENLSALVLPNVNLGFQMRFRLTVLPGAGYSSRRAISLITMKTTVDPSTWSIGDARIYLQGPSVTDTVEVVLTDTSQVIATLTGSGDHEFNVGSNVNKKAFFIRKNATGVELMRTQAKPIVLEYGDNGVAYLFYGQEVQLAQSGEVTGFAKTLDSMDYSIKEFQGSSSLVATKVERLNADLRVVKAKLL